MNWTKTAPTKAGDWKWKSEDGAMLMLSTYWKYGVIWTAPPGLGEGIEAAKLPGEWLPLYGGDVLAAEVEKAAREADAAFSCGESDRYWKEWWPESRAKRITTGETEPSL